MFDAYFLFSCHRLCIDMRGKKNEKVFAIVISSQPFERERGRERDKIEESTSLFSPQRVNFVPFVWHFKIIGRSETAVSTIIAFHLLLFARRYCTLFIPYTCTVTWSYHTTDACRFVPSTLRAFWQPCSLSRSNY